MIALPQFRVGRSPDAGRSPVAQNAPRMWWPLLVHLSMTLPLACGLNLWLDEAYTLDTTSQGPARALSQAIRFEVQAPLYFVLLSLWRLVTDSITWARLFSVGCAAWLVSLSPLLARRWLADGAQRWFPWMMALHPTVIWAAVETRNYALTMLLAGALLVVWPDRRQAQTGRRLDPKLVALAVAGLYTNYFFGFFLAALYSIDWWMGNPDFRMRLVREAACIGLLFLPLAACLPQQMRTREAVIHLESAPEDALYREDEGSVGKVKFAALKAVGSLSHHLFPAPSSSKWVPARLLALAGWLACLAWPGRAGKRIRGEPATFWNLSWTAWFFLAALLIGDSGLRHATLFVPVVLLSIGSLLGPLSRTRRLWGMAVLIGIYGACLLARYLPFAKNGDFIRVARWIETEESPGQPVFVYDLMDAEAFRHHYHGRNRVEPLPKPATFVVYHVDNSRLPPLEGLERRLAEVPGNGSLWLVIDTGPIRGIPELTSSFRRLDEIVATRFTVRLERDFLGSKVYLLDWKK